MLVITINVRLDDSVTRQFVRLGEKTQGQGDARFTGSISKTRIQKEKKWKIIFQLYSNQKKAGVTILIRDKH